MKIRKPMNTTDCDARKFLLIDTSYLVFLYIHGVYTRNHNYGQFRDAFYNCVLRTARNFDITDGDIFFAIDCPRSHIWRNAHFPKYKENRSNRKDIRPLGDDGGLGIADIFKKVRDEIVVDLCDEGIANMISVPTAEADDIIAVGTRLLNQRFPKSQVIILGIDTDYTQLLDCSLNDVVNTRGFSLREKYGLYDKNTQRTKASHLLLQKILMGDKSDGISGVFFRCGPKTANKLIENPSYMKKKVFDVPSALELYKRNQLLINFDNIPRELKSQINVEFLHIVGANIVLSPTHTN